MNEDLEHLQNTLQSTRKELKNVKVVLGTLISWLDHEIGRHNVQKLLADLNSQEA